MSNGTPSQDEKAAEMIRAMKNTYLNLKKESHYDEDMEAVPRPELEARLAATEARVDARLSKFDTDMRQVVNDFRLEMAPLKNLKANVWGAAGAVVAAMIAVMALGYSAFDTGRETSKAGYEAVQQTQETRRLLDQMKAQQAALTPVTPTPAAAASSK